MKQNNLLGLDFGEKKVGIAFKAAGELFPSPLGNFKNQGDLIGKVVALAKEKQIQCVVVGYPKSLNTKKSPITLKVELFIKNLRENLPHKIEIISIDETFSTRESIERLRFLGKSPAFIEKNKDTYSAVLILERYLGIS